MKSYRDKVALNAAIRFCHRVTEANLKIEDLIRLSCGDPVAEKETDWEELQGKAYLGLRKIYGDRSRHAFFSERERDEEVDRRGPRGGKLRGRKAVCAYCGGASFLHAEETEII